MKFKTLSEPPPICYSSNPTARCYSRCPLRFMLVTYNFPSLCNIVIGKTYICQICMDKSVLYLHRSRIWDWFVLSASHIIIWTIHTSSYKLSAWCATFHDLWKLDACVDTCNVDKCKVEKSNYYILNSRSRQHF